MEQLAQQVQQLQEFTQQVQQLQVQVQQLQVQVEQLQSQALLQQQQQEGPETFRISSVVSVQSGATTCGSGLSWAASWVG